MTELQKILDVLWKGALILDVRTRKEYAEGHFNNAINIPTPLPPLKDCDIYRLVVDLHNATKKYCRHFPVILYCKKGIRAEKAKEILECLGHTKVINVGGIEDEPMKSIVQKGGLIARHPTKGRVLHLHWIKS